MFKDRSEAGIRLAENLAEYRGGDAVVLALPRGGVVTGREVADALKLPLDIVVVRKVGHPYSPEFALCAVDARGTLICDEREAASVDRGWLNAEIERQKQEAIRRLAAYRGNREPAPVGGKTAILVDDGAATGLTMRLAIVAARAQNTARVVVAVPVASRAAAEVLKRAADELVVVEPPENFFGSVGAHYEEFEQVEDSEVIRLLREFMN